MGEHLFLQQTTDSHRISTRQAIVLICLLVQIGFTIFLFVNNYLIYQPDIIMRTVTGQPGPDNQQLCQIISVQPFSDAWIHNVQPGSYAYPVSNRLLGAPEGTFNSCKIQGGSVFLQSEGGPLFTAHGVVAQHGDTIDIAIACILGIIFDIAGITIFMRAQDRPTARVAFALFYCVSLMCTLLGVTSFDMLWVGPLIIIEISQRLCVTVKTIETHLTSLYGKLGVQSRAEAIALAQRQGLLLEG